MFAQKLAMSGPVSLSLSLLVTRRMWEGESWGGGKRKRKGEGEEREHFVELYITHTSYNPAIEDVYFSEFVCVCVCLCTVWHPRVSLPSALFETGSVLFPLCERAGWPACSQGLWLLFLPPPHWDSRMSDASFHARPFLDSDCSSKT